jgi:hypothetical protein
MHPHYPALNRDLKVVAAFEKVSAHIEPEFQPDAQEKLALVCDEVFEGVRAKSGGNVIDYLITMRESHLDSGEKTAVSSEVVYDTLLKLAAALHVDEVLTKAARVETGETKTAALNARALGREYAVTLMRNLLA